MNNLSSAAAIVIPSWIPEELASARVPLLEQTIASIHDTARGWPFELVVVDQGDGPWQTNVLAHLVRTRRVHHVVLNAWNTYYAGGLDQGIHLTSAPYLAFSANDLTYEPGWLATLIGALEDVGAHGGTEGRDVIAAGSKGWHRDPRHVVGKITVAGEEWDYMDRADPYCWVMRRATYQRIGPFPWVLHADAMWTTRASAAGQRWICPPRELVHHVGARGDIRGAIRDRMKANAYDRRAALTGAHEASKESP